MSTSNMPLGIKPTVDFAFKKIFGSPQNSVSLIGLLNAILELERPVTSVEILNPFSYQEFAESKLIVLDVRCKDTAGRMLNVEMQVSVYAGLIERLVYYSCSMYVDQLAAGENYASAAPCISICLLNHILFPRTSQPHHHFQMADKNSGLVLEKAVEVHTVELTKYNLKEETISEASKLEQWAFLLLRAQDFEASELERLLPGIDFAAAIETIQIIAAKTEDKQMYDQREKAQRDYEWALSGAKQEGLEEGRQHGKLTGQIQLLQKLLAETPTTDADLQLLSYDALEAKLADLQQRLRDRQAQA